MNRKELRKQREPASPVVAKTAERTARTITSRDVYNFVVTYEDDSKRKGRQVNSLVAMDLNGIETSRQEDEMDDYSSERFEDEKDCEVQSVMTSHPESSPTRRSHATTADLSNAKKQEKGETQDEDEQTRENSDIHKDDITSTIDNERSGSSMGEHGLQHQPTPVATQQQNEKDLHEDDDTERHQLNTPGLDDSLTDDPHVTPSPVAKQQPNKDENNTSEHRRSSKTSTTSSQTSEQDQSLQGRSRENSIASSLTDKSSGSDCSSDSHLRGSFPSKSVQSKISRRKTLPLTANTIGIPPRKPLALLTTKGDPKKHNLREEMHKVVQEVILRGQHKVKDLKTTVQHLQHDSEVLREENKALKKLQKLQGREVREIDRFVAMTNTSAKVIRQDLRDAESTCCSMNNSIMKKNKLILQLKQECDKYEKLFDMDATMPRKSVLEEKLEKAEKNLNRKDKEIETLSKKAKMQEKKTIKSRQKENKEFAQLGGEVQETISERDELKQRLKEAERKLDKSNIYSRKSINRTMQPALPAPQNVPALTWYPPTIEQTPNSKVTKWLNDSNNNYKK